MKPENQVCNLELSKRLRELGVKQESLFYWIISDENTKDGNKVKPVYLGYTAGIPRSSDSFNGYYAAFTVAELGEMLPEFYASRRIGKTRWEAFKTFVTAIQAHEEQADTEADARARMLIYILENKLINT